MNQSRVLATRRFSRAWWKVWTVRALAIIGLMAISREILIPQIVIPTRIISNSMSPTLQGTNWEDGDSVMIERLTYWFRKPRRWEVIAFRNDAGVYVMKRAVGLPGERVQMQRNGDLYINGELQPRPEWLKHIKYLPVARVNGFRAVDCGDGYFVLGDHTQDSDDSRFEPPLPAHRVLGRGWFIFGPWARVGGVH